MKNKRKWTAMMSVRCLQTTEQFMSWVLILGGIILKQLGRRLVC